MYRARSRWQRRAMFRSQADFQPTIERAAEILGISALAVEKDYWVSQALRVLAEQFPDDFVFKGGTSLSKGFGLIERFSEDIDILIVKGDRSRGAIDRLMKSMGDAAGEALGATPTSEHPETGRHRTYRIGFPTDRPRTTAIEPSVLLEMGIRGGDHPSQRIEIGTLLGDTLATAGTQVSEYSDLERFELTVLHPGRTLLEKLYVIHAEAVRLCADTAEVVRPGKGRHFYDVYQLLADDNVAVLLANDDLVSSILEEIEEVTTTHFTSGVVGELRPEGGFRSSPAFDPASNAADRLRAGYEADMEELYFGGTPPTWEQICRRVSSSRV